MPKLTIARVAWNPQDASYQVNEKAGQETDLSPMDFENQTWQEWLERVPSFAFQSKDGHRFTARKETRAHGSGYWVAYRKIGGKLTHTYIGRSEDITLSPLEQVAHSFIEQKSKPPAPHPRRSTCSPPNSLCRWPRTP